MTPSMDIASLSLAEKKEMMAALLKKKAAQVKAYPTSFAQRRLWFLDRMDPGQPFYNHSRVYMFEGPLHADLLNQAFLAVIKRQAALRTCFGQDADGAPQQIVHPAVAFQIKEVDLSDWSATAAEEKYRALVREQAGTVFNLDTAPLFRAQLIALGQEKHALVVTFHHILVDGWSMGVFLDELLAHYRGLTTGEAVALPELPISYADFSIWQNNRLKKDVLQAQIDYWVNRLTGQLPVYELPQDFKRPHTRSFEGANTRLALSRQLTEQLSTLSRHRSATLFMVLLAAFKVLMHRYTGETDILVGSPIANRNRAEIEHLIGFFVNTLALRTQVQGNPTFEMLVDRVRETTLGAYAHQDLPFEKVVEVLHPTREVNHTPIVQVMFILQNAPKSRQALDHLRVTSLDVDSGTSKFDLIFQFEETEDGLTATVNYNTSLFRNTTVNRMLRHLRCLLQDIVDNPRIPIERLRLLTKEESDQITYDWNYTDKPFPSDKTIHQVFEERVNSNPEDSALHFDSDRLNYGRLDQLANQVAQLLIAKGIGHGENVALCMKPSCNLVAAILGVLKAGCAYVPLDPSHPLDRLTFMLQDSKSRLLLVDEHNYEQFLAAGVPLQLLHADNRELQGFSTHRPGIPGHPDDLAYMIYTSGSTGTPKGVAVPHRAVNRLVLNTDYVVFQPEIKVGQIANFSFDAVTFELWGALLNGAELVGIPKELILSPEPFARRLKELHIGCMFITTALFNHVISVVPTAFENFRYLIVGGEAVEPHWVEVALSKGPPLNLLNGYGPTENTTFSTWYTIRGVTERTVNVPIGHPIANSTCYVMDKNLQIVPVGIIGELFVGGAGLARGYFDRPRLTAEKFTPHPFSKEPGLRLYRTGDLVHRMASGEIVFNGRIDNQVKIRGFRIELSEIVKVMDQYENVQESVAKVWRLPDKRIVAYVVAKPGLDIEQLRAFLKQRLPDYMIPATFVTLDHIPFTPNGKVDHRALPEPEQVEAGERPKLMPETQTQKAIAGIWEELFNIQAPALQENFFDLGGHSLLVTRLASRIRERFGCELTLRELFDGPTIEAIAARVDARMTVAPANEAPLASAMPSLGGRARQGRKIVLDTEGMASQTQSN